MQPTLCMPVLTVFKRFASEKRQTVLHINIVMQILFELSHVLSRGCNSNNSSASLYPSSLKQAITNRYKRLPMR